MTPTLSRAALAMLALTLAGCGQKGPLYLPDSTQGEVITRPTQTPAETPPEATDPEKDKKKDGATPPK